MKFNNINEREQKMLCVGNLLRVSPLKMYTVIYLCVAKPVESSGG